MRLILLFLLFLPGRSQVIPENANTIVVNTRLSDPETYQKFVDFLKQNGWRRDQDEYRMKGIVTNYKYIPSTGWLRLVASVGASSIRLRGEYTVQSPSFSGLSYPVVNKGMEGEASKVNFNSLNEVALRLKEAIPGASIKYAVSAE